MLSWKLLKKLQKVHNERESYNVLTCIIIITIVYSDTGQLKMILMSGCVQVEHVRQKKSWSFTSRDEHFGVVLCELKAIRPLFLTEDELATLEHSHSSESFLAAQCHYRQLL